MILFEGADTVAAVFLEPVQNSGGCFPPPPGYFQRVREICDQYDVLLVSDEVICAFGRIGHMFACDAYGYVPDMITCAKAMTSGYSPIGATIVSDKVYEPFRHGTTAFYHGYTFGGHPVSSAVALENLDIFEEEKLNERVRENSPIFRSTLEKLKDLPIVGDVRGDGYFFGIELVKDKATRRRRSTTPSPSGCCAGSSRRRSTTPASTAAPTTAATPSSNSLPRSRSARPSSTRSSRSCAACSPRRGPGCDLGRRPRFAPRFARYSSWIPRNMTQTEEQTYYDLSFWHETAGDLTPRAGLDGDTEADVAIVGGGLTGLWTAWYLLERDPALRIVVLEKEIAGFGASGRNGGWCSALFPRSTASLERAHGRPAALAMRRAMIDTIAEVERSPRRSPLRLRARAERSPTRGHEFRSAQPAPRSPKQTPTASTRSDGVAARAWALRERSARASIAAVQASIPRNSCGDSPRPSRRAACASSRAPRSPTSRRAGSTTARGVVTADRVVVATEGYTATFPATQRRILPLYSLMIATEPLPESFWDEVQIAHGETFTDYRHLLIYGQRTADDRFAFGGRGARYHWGSAIRPEYDRAPRVFEHLRRTLVELFPAAARRRGHPPLGRAARGSARLARVGRRTTPRRASAAPAATSATGFRRPTWPAAPSPTC